MKVIFVLSIILILSFGQQLNTTEGYDAYTFNLALDSTNSTKMYDRGVEFRVSPWTKYFGVRCDSQTYDIWSTSYSSSIYIYSSDRQSYNCSDTNFTVTIQTYSYDEFYEISILDPYTGSTYYQQQFIVDVSSYNSISISENTGTYLFPYYDVSEFNISCWYCSQQVVYIEMFQCPSDYNTISISQINSTRTYRNITSMKNNLFYDQIYVAHLEEFQYRIRTMYNNHPAMYIKYQYASLFNIPTIQNYADQSYYPQAYNNGDYVELQIPTIDTKYSETVVFDILIVHQNFDTKYISCSFGDTSLLNSYGNNNHYIYSRVYQNSYIYSTYQTQYFNINNYAHNGNGYYNVYIYARINTTYGVAQTIPYSSTSFYFIESKTINGEGIHIFAPIIVFGIALLTILVALFFYNKNRKAKYQNAPIVQPQIYSHSVQNNGNIQ